jgi:type III restriction enzyme
MIQLKTYQEEAVNALVKDTFALLGQPGAHHKMVLKAPTGAGKTVSIAAYLDRLSAELAARSETSNSNVAFIWFAPNQLHLQSYLSLTSYFEELRSIKPIQFEDITDGTLHPNEILFVNWQSVNKANNVYIKENEQGKDLIKIVHAAMLADTEIICILDEAHYHADGKKAKALLKEIQAKIEIDVSATPLYRSDYGHTIKRHEVVQAEMIKQKVVLNPGLDNRNQDGKGLRQILLEEALKKRQNIRDAYQAMGVDINPLLLIQLPNETKNESSLDRELIAEVKAFLEVKGITGNNEKLAVWLSDTKSNLEGLEEPNSLTEVLLFKQAIALGWDCPRAAVLLIFREITQTHFGIQTVGRILRMPEQKHYTNALLNNGYVYTDLSKDIIQIQAEEMDYIVQNSAKRIEDYEDIELLSSYINRRIVRNRLGSKFRRCLYEAAEEYFEITLDPTKTNQEGLFPYNHKQLSKKFVETNVDKIEIPIPKNLEIKAEIGSTTVKEKEIFAKTIGELNRIFNDFCRINTGQYASVDSTPVLEMGLKTMFEEYLGLAEFVCTKVVLFENNKSKFIELIDIALEKHQLLLDEKAANTSRDIHTDIWEVPEERIFNEHYKERPVDKHALVPFYEQNKASSPEQEFATYLENNKDHIEWWYKNGDQNKEDFAVTYEDSQGVTKGFYVDFVIKLKSGAIALFDTKTLGSDPNFVAKHNALHQYIKASSTKSKLLMGGVIVPKGTWDNRTWKYAENLIDRSDSTTGWVSFEPSMTTPKAT